MIVSGLGLLFWILDFLGVFIGAFGGAVDAIRENRYKYDFIGVLGLAFTSALGGGIVRDVVLQKGPPLAFLDIRYELIAFAGAFVALAFRSRIGTRADRMIVIIDAAVIGFFSVAGTTRALHAGLMPLPSILLGVVTAVGGGSLRDVLSGTVPRIFERGQFYAIAALAGAGTYFLLCRAGMPEAISSALAVAICFSLRILSWKFNWRTRPVRNSVPVGD